MLFRVVIFYSVEKKKLTLGYILLLVFIIIYVAFFFITIYVLWPIFLIFVVISCLITTIGLIKYLQIHLRIKKKNRKDKKKSLIKIKKKT